MVIYTGHGDRQDPICSVAPHTHLEIGASYPVYAGIHCDIMWLDLDGRRFFRVPYSGFAGSGPGLGSVLLTSRDHAVFEGRHSYRVELSARAEDAQTAAECM